MGVRWCTQRSLRAPALLRGDSPESALLRQLRFVVRLRPVFNRIAVCVQPHSDHIRPHPPPRFPADDLDDSVGNILPRQLRLRNRQLRLVADLI